MNQKYNLLAALAAILLLLPTVLTACGKAPTLDEVYDDFSALIEASYEINDIIFGEGLSTHDRDGSYAVENFIYYGFEVSKFYLLAV